jgi:hypothetical protein
MDDAQAKRIEELEDRLAQLERKLEALEGTVEQIFRELRALYEQEDFAQP